MSGRARAVDEPTLDAGKEPYGVANGFTRWTGVILSLSGVPGRTGVAAADDMVGWRC